MTQWNGFHHVALVTPDLDATIAFYGDLLGMEVGKVFSAEGERGRHCFISPGNSWGLHFFEHPTAEIFDSEPVMQNRFGFLPGALQHIAFALPDELAGVALQARLREHNITTSPINEIGPIRNILFTDNNGIMLEAAWAK